MTLAEKLLKWLLIGAGLFCSIAAVPMLMPRPWMAACHEWMGMGAFPAQPVAEYLARLTSGMYAFYGGLLLFLSTGVRRYRRVIAYQAVAIAAIASLGLFYGGMPRWWLIADFGSAAGQCAAVLILQAVIAAQDRRRAKAG